MLTARTFKLTPAAKDYLWGGNRINEIFNKNIDLSPLAETWECSTHPDGPSIVSSGEFAGDDLARLFLAYPEFWSPKFGRVSEFPLLVKFIDAKQSLSVQVHPTDEYAQKVENQPRGKTEVWYIIDAEPDAKIVYGFSRKVTPDEVAEAAKNGTLESLLNFVPVKAGDVIPIPAGTVHAIGAGILLAEIQENSNLTYRLYDWNRVGADGKPRQLHVEKAKDVMICDSVPPFSGQFREEKPGRETLVENKWFRFDRLVNEGVSQLEKDKNIFNIFLCIRGSGVCDGVEFKAGDCIFVPRTVESPAIEGSFTALISQ